MTTSDTSSFTGVNIDFGTTRLVPSQSYGAAGISGVWNVVSSLDSSEVNDFVDIEGNSIPLTVSSSQDLFDVVPFSQPFSGDDGNLLGDYLVFGRNDFTLTFSHLPNGIYEILTYTTLGRQDFLGESTVTPFGDSSLTKTNTGIWDGSFQEGVTHSLHTLEITTGSCMAIKTMISLKGEPEMISSMVVRRMILSSVKREKIPYLVISVMITSTV